MLCTSRTVPPIECFYFYECYNSTGVLERFVFTGRMPFLTPNQAHQVCKEAQGARKVENINILDDMPGGIPGLGVVGADVKLVKPENFGTFW